MARNDNLNNAKKAKNDEFYTMLKDIREELQYYTQHFKDKVVYCNCDDPTWSNFWFYFYDNFHKLKLKKLISTYYNEGCKSYRTEYDGIETTRILLNGDGDFRSRECEEILQECDIVVTNPPFSLFSSYVKQLIENHKKFLIIGNINAYTSAYLFPIFKNGEIWLGCNNDCKMNFYVPEHYKSGIRDEDGRRIAPVSMTVWYTNLTHNGKPKELKKRVIEYNKYDNYDAINTDRIEDIPNDYQGLIGVPITYIKKHNPDEFDIVDIIRPLIKGKALYKRLIIKRKKKAAVSSVADIKKAA